MLRVLVRHSRDRQAPLFNFRSYARVHKLCCQFKARFGLTIDFTPHSLRAGSATDDKLCGMSLGEIQFRGRWESIATAKGYVDVVYGEVVRIHVNDNVINKEGKMDIKKIRPLARLGYYDYTSVTDVFEMRIPGASSKASDGLEGKSS